LEPQSKGATVSGAAWFDGEYRGAMTRERIARVAAIAGAAVGAAALVLQLILLAEVIRGQGGSLLSAVWRFLGFFTLLTNIAAVSVLAHAVLRTGSRRGLGGPRVELAVATAIAMVGIIYSLALRELWSPEGWQKIADIILHDAMPVIFVLYFLTQGHASLRWRDAAYALVMPAAYCAYALARGATDGWYAYPFLDPTRLSAAALAGNAAGLTLVFLACALLLVGLAKLLRSR